MLLVEDSEDRGGRGVDPVAVIVAALAAGVATGAGDTASSLVKDAYAGLKALLQRRFAGDPKAAATLADHAADPETYEKPMAKQLSETGAATDEQIVAAARAVLEASDPAGSRAGKYQVDLRGAQGVQVGDGGSMTVSFSAAAERPRPHD